MRKPHEILLYLLSCLSADSPEGRQDVPLVHTSCHVKAFDPTTGREVWSWRSQQPIVSSILATAGDLIFADAPNGNFDAFNARTGALLWQFNSLVVFALP